MPFIKGEPRTKQEQKKAKYSRHIKFGDGVCISCGEIFSKYSQSSLTCGKKECLLIKKKTAYEQEKITDPTGALARRMTGSIRLPNKKKIVTQMITDALHKPCVYCGDIINIHNASLDHKEPRNFAKVYNRATRKREYSYAELLTIDHPDNLQIICKECNQHKSDFNDEQYKALLSFLNDRPDIKTLLFKRLKYARMAWKNFTSYRHQ